VVLALGGVVAVAMPAAAAESCPTGDPCIAVHLQGGTKYVTATQITSEATAAADADAANAVQDVQYPETATVAGPYVALGLSENALLADLLGSSASGVTFTELTRPYDGSHSLLQASAGDLSAPSSFVGGLLPVFYVDGPQILYARPIRSSSDNAAADDEIESAQGGPLDLYVHTGPLLTVTASADPMTAKVGQSITLDASSSGDSVTPTYTWRLFPSDQKIGVGARITHAFAVAGTYEVLLSAQGADDSGGFADPLFVTVGHARVSPSHSPSPGGSRTPTPSPSLHPSSTPSPSTSALGGRSGGSTRSPSPGTSGSGVASGRSTPPPSSLAGRPVVSGRLIGQGVALLSAPSAPAVGTQAEGSAATPLSSGWRVSSAAAAIAAIMLLFGLGAARELRWARRRRSAVRQH